MLPIQRRAPAFSLNLNLLSRVWQPTADYNGRLARPNYEKSVPNVSLQLLRAAPPDQITQQNSLQRTEEHKRQ
jgi:hypothetical protein